MLDFVPTRRGFLGTAAAMGFGQSIVRDRGSIPLNIGVTDWNLNLAARM